MAIPTLDTSQKTTSTNSGTWTLAHTCSGSDRFLKVTIVRGAPTTSVNYNGTPMALVHVTNGRLSFSALVTMYLEVWVLKNPTSGANNIQIVGPGGAPDAIVLIAESFNGVDQTTPTGTVQTDFQDNQTDLQCNLTFSSNADELISDAFISYARTMAANGGQTETQNGGNTGAQSCATSYKTGASSVNVGWTVPTNQLRGLIAFPIKGLVAAAEQEGFRFRNDDGSETTATWAAAQDTNASVAVNTPIRLRTLINSTNDLPSSQFQLEYRVQGSGDPWKKVE